MGLPRRGDRRWCSGVVDVRLNPLSRRRGFRFSKRALTGVLAGVGHGISIWAGAGQHEIEPGRPRVLSGIGPPRGAGMTGCSWSRLAGRRWLGSPGCR